MKNILVISTYCCKSEISKFRTAILYNNYDEILKKLKDFITSNLERIIKDSHNDFDIKKKEVTFANIVSYIMINFMDILETSKEDKYYYQEEDFIIWVPEIQTDFKIDIIGPLNDNYNWLLSNNSIGILANYTENFNKRYLEILKIYSLDSSDDGNYREIIPDYLGYSNEEIIDFTEVGCTIPLI